MRKLRYNFINHSKMRLLCLIVLVGIIACKNTSGNQVEEKLKTEIVEGKDAYGHTEIYSRNVKDYAKQGKYTRYDSLGNLLELAFYKRDTLHGNRVLFYETGDTQTVETYQMGQFDGVFKAFYEEGSLELIGNYTSNTMNGSWKKYYPSGQLMEIVEFKNNEENGPFVEYHENGNLKAEGSYLEGDKEHGPLKLYNEEGQLIRKMDCNRGICRTTWQADKNQKT